MQCFLKTFKDRIKICDLKSLDEGKSGDTPIRVSGYPESLGQYVSMFHVMLTLNQRIIGLLFSSLQP